MVEVIDTYMMPLNRDNDVFRVIDEMHAISRQLTPLSYPKVSPHEEQEVEILKTRRITLDGYNLEVRLSRSEHMECFIEALEISGIEIPFLPFNLVCKVAALFLGGHELKYAESFRRGRKVYIWTVAVDSRGCPMLVDDPQLESTSYEGVKYSYRPSELL